jgi:protein gp37
MNRTGISWTDFTWNPVSGCTKVSEGCKFCYAEAWSRRWHRPFEVTLHPEKLGEVRKIPPGSKVFVNSMSDLFHPKVPPNFTVKVFRAIESRPDVTFQILTKRPELIGAYTSSIDSGGDFEELLAPANAWFGVSVENIHHKDRIAWLRHFKYEWPLLQLSKIFVSFEPLLGGVGKLNLKGIDWVVIGGESGPHHRPMKLEWARNIVKQAKEQGVAVWMKQLGGMRPGGNLEDFPEDLRIREFPHEMKVMEALK